MQGYTNASAAATIRLVNQSATFSTQSTPDYAAYPCRAAIAITGCTTLKQATVTYNPTEAISGKYAPFCETYDGGVYLYSKVAGTITVAAIVLEGVSNFYNMEATPTQNSGNPITSGGVYTNCVRIDGVQTITGQKILAGELPTSQPSSGATSTPIQYKFYGGTTVSGSAYWNFANINFLNKDNALHGFVGPIQYGSTNTDGGNGFRIGLRDRENTTWKAFLEMYDNGAMNWGGNHILNTSDALTITSVMRYPGSGNASNATSYVTPQAIANWNGAYTSTTSNLAYCNQGAFGNACIQSIDNTTTIGSLMNLANWTQSTNLTTRNTIAHWDGSYQSNPKISNLAYCVHGAIGNIVTRSLTISTGAPSGGSNGDIWIQY